MGRKVRQRIFRSAKRKNIRVNRHLESSGRPNTVAKLFLLLLPSSSFWNDRLTCSAVLQPQRYFLQWRRCVFLEYTETCDHPDCPIPTPTRKSYVMIADRAAWG